VDQIFYTSRIYPFSFIQWEPATFGFVPIHPSTHSPTVQPTNQPTNQMSITFRYGAWAGKDATVALGMMSLDPHDAGSTDYGRLGPAQWKTVLQWRDYFDQKYRVVGVLPDVADAVASGVAGLPTPTLKPH